MTATGGKRRRRRAALLFLLLCAGVAIVIHFEAPEATPPPERTAQGNFKVVGIDGWKVKSIEDNHITLVLGDKEMELKSSDHETRQGLSASPGPSLAGLSSTRLPSQLPSAGIPDVPYRDPDAPPVNPSAIQPPSTGTSDVPYRDPDAPPETP